MRCLSRRPLFAGIAAVAIFAPVVAHSQTARVGRTDPPGPPGTVSIPERDRALIRSYFGRTFTNGPCPPGLAKKETSCVPPGQAKSWTKGQPLGPRVVAAPLPNDLLVQLKTPVGYQFVRVLNDVLLIAHDNRVVTDAVADLR